MFEACRIAPGAFHHREHVRLAYIYLCDGDVLEAHRKLLAVDCCMDRSEPAVSSDAFIGANPRLLDTGIMLTHYSKEALFSADARTRFVEPDLEPIPHRIAE